MGKPTQQTYRSVCDHCEDIVEETLEVGPEWEMVALVLKARCGHARTAFASPQRDKQCAAYYSEKHPAAVAEVKAVVAQLDAGVDAADVQMNAAAAMPRAPAAVDWRQFIQGTRTNARGLREVKISGNWYIDTEYELERRGKGGQS